jgi:hypothetical protein
MSRVFGGFRVSDVACVGLDGQYLLQDTLLETSSRCAHLISFTGGYSLLSDLEPSLFQTQLTLFQPSALSETLHISC